MVSIKQKGESLRVKAVFVALSAFLLCAFSLQLQAQTWGEWWSQKKTQLSYLEQQIAALQVYGGYVKRGYDISQNGLGAIGGLRSGELNLHQNYYASLKKVNPAVAASAQAIVPYLQVIAQQANGLTGTDYVVAVRKQVVQENERDVAELELVVTSGEASMTDDGRLKHLDQLYARAKDRFTFLQHFVNQARILRLQEERSGHEVR